MITSSKQEKALAELVDDPQPVELNLTKVSAWQLMATMQLACRHPRFTGPTRVAVESIARMLQSALCANNNELRMMAEFGWHKQFDYQPAAETPSGPTPSESLSRDEMNFLLWCLGFVLGRVKIEKGDHATDAIAEKINALKNKLMTMVSAAVD